MSRPIRILQYIGSLNSGGSQSMIMNIYRNIDRNKIQFDFIIDQKDRPFHEEEIKKLGGKIYIFDENFRGYNYLSFTKQWKDFFKTHPEYRIIHCHVRSVASIVLKIAKQYGLNTICHSHNISNGKGLRAFIKKIIQIKIPKYSDIMLACSDEAGKWLYGKKAHYLVIKNSIEQSRYYYNAAYRKEIRKKYKISDDKYIIGHVGRFEKQKNHSFIVNIIKNLNNDNNLVFMLCGDGSLRPQIKAKLEKEIKEKKVYLINNTTDIYKYYSAFDCFILPSTYEGLGIVLIEAQFSGLRCIVSPNVPEEAKISQNYVKEPLDSNKWAKVIAEKKTEPDRSAPRLLNNSSTYNIKNAINVIERLYLNCDAQKGEN